MPTGTVTPVVSGGFSTFFNSTLAAPAASFDITSIPGGFSLLQLFLLLRSTKAATYDDLYIRINGDTTGGNYCTQLLYAAGTGNAGAESHVGQAGIYSQACGGTAPATAFSQLAVDLLDYANATRLKTATSSGSLLTDTTANGTTVEQSIAFWLSAAAITRLTVIAGGGNLDTGSRCIVRLS